MILPEYLSPDISAAMQNERFRKAVESLAQAYVAASQWSRGKEQDANQVIQANHDALPWHELRQEHLMVLLERLTKQAERGKEQEYEDNPNDINSLRGLWSLCFERFAQRSVKATNEVTPNWTSSSQDTRNIAIQRRAIARGVSIDRMYILDKGKGIPDHILHELRATITQQLNAKIRLYVVRPGAIRFANTSQLRTNDFIIFDDQLVYATIVDMADDIRERKNTFVRLFDDQGMVQKAQNAWDDLLTRAEDELNYENLRKYVDPFGRYSDDY